MYKLILTLTVYALPLESYLVYRNKNQVIKSKWCLFSNENIDRGAELATKFSQVDLCF